MAHKWEEWLRNPAVVLASRGMLTGWRKGLTGNSWSAWGNVKSCTWGGIAAGTRTCWLADWEAPLQGKALVTWYTTSWPWAAMHPWGKEGQQTLACTRKSSASRRREVILPLSTGVVTPGVLWSVLGSQYKRDMERFQHKATELMKGPEHIWYEMGLRELGLFSQ